MDAITELQERLAQRRREALGGLSDVAFIELSQAVQQDPKRFIDHPDDQAFYDFVCALDAFNKLREGEEFLDDELFEQTRTSHLNQARESFSRIAEQYPSCYDARLAEALVTNQNPDHLLDALSDLKQETQKLCLSCTNKTPSLYKNVFARPHFRVLQAMALACMDSARYKLALTFAQKLMELDAKDPLGGRFSAALAYARLEDQEGFAALEKNCSVQAPHEFGVKLSSNAWFNLSRTILWYKLGKLSAASRALRGFDNLSQGGAFALMRPVFMDMYVPDRPLFTPESFEETLLAVHEAEPILADIPDFVNWCTSHEWFIESAEAFARRRGFE